MKQKYNYCLRNLTSCWIFAKPYLTGQVVSGEDITIPLSEISEQAKWYDYVVDGTTVSFYSKSYRW